MTSAPGDPSPPSLSHIVVRGAREHNLRDLELQIPRDRLVVITGLSGSGKSSLAFDTIYAEGQRRYVESLSAYARQFLEQMSKPDVDSIDGLSPAIAIEQKTVSKNPRSTVGTTTEIYDYLRLLFARAGQPHCPGCGQPISSQTVQQMSDRVLGLGEGARVQVMAPVVRDHKGEYKKELDEFRRQGFVRIRVDGEVRDLFEDISLSRKSKHTLEVVVDRLVVKEAVRGRISESIETALRLSDGLVGIDIGPGDEEWLLSERNACVDCGISYPEIAPRMFSFNSPHGACESCSGLGTTEDFDPARVVPDASLSLERGAIAPWSGRKAPRYYAQLTTALATHFGVDRDTPWCDLARRVQRGILFGIKGELDLTVDRAEGEESFRRRWDGVMAELGRRYEAGNENLRGELGRFRAPRSCEACNGTRLRIEARSVRIADRSIDQLAALSVEDAHDFLENLELSPTQLAIAERILREIRQRLRFLTDVGLAYLTLDRSGASLSGGEGQRIRLATQVGSSLMGVLYILDEPSIGLHPRDNERLLASLKRLRDLGNSVLVVEHDETTIRAADHVIDMGPGAGIHGGFITAQGTPEEIVANEQSLTGAYLSGRRRIEIPRRRKPARREIAIEGCTQHNLKDVTLRVPLGVLTVVTGVSGSGKSTLINDTLFRVLAARLHNSHEAPGAFRRIRGLEHIDKVIDVNQAPIGRTPRSNPATYTGILDGIRSLMSQVPESRVRGYTPGRFSFNVKGGRCEACHGDGILRIEMHFLPDIFVTCEVCNGRRYNRETLEITYKGRSIADVLEMTVEEALVFMENVSSVQRPLQTLHDVGLGYIHLGQPATTLSGGEAQRIKLARELSRKSTGRTLYLLDEPTTGLHFADVEKLLEVLNRLVDAGNSVVVIEHHPDVIKTADHVIDLGPEGGARGGEIVITGTPEEVAAHPGSHTGRALRALLPL
ncbi:MAG: excinuclease ABC subunit UvrA [Myxococcales bacterium]|nr:excinuclease ABC subunit UvrA [Myxococcales bacterium]